MQPSLDRGLKIIALPIAEEASDAPSDTGSEVELLMAEFPEKVEFGKALLFLLMAINNGALREM